MFSLPTTVTVSGRAEPRPGEKSPGLIRRERDFLRQNPDLVQPPVRLTEAETAFLKDWA